MVSFFGPTPGYDQFLDDFVAPVMTAAGFRRANKMFRLTDAGSTVIVQLALVMPGPLVGFQVNTGVVPPILRRYLREQSPSWRPSLNKCLMQVPLRKPLDRSEIFGDRRMAELWVYPDPGQQLPDPRLEKRAARLEVFGPAFRDLLEHEAIPEWQRRLSPQYLLDTYDEKEIAGQDFSRWAGPTWLKAILGVEVGEPEQAEAALDSLEPLNPKSRLIPWLRQQLANTSPTP